MASAVVVAVIFMMVFVGPVARFIDEHPAFKMLALSFLLLIGVALIGEGLSFHVPKGYLYFAMGFSAFVELLNIRIRRRPERPVQLRSPITE
jgi:predicted tellurium resistance membrane protein TerC